MLKRALLAFLLVLPAGIGIAHADETKDCATAYEQTQRLQQKQELLSALDAAERCSRPTCPQLLKDECAQWVTDIKPKVPTVIVRVKDSNGCTAANAKVEVPGPSRKEGEALLVDPGAHVLTVFDPATNQSKQQPINFGPGERRDIDIDFAQPGAQCKGDIVTIEPTKSQKIRVPKVTLILGAAGGGLMLVGGVLGIIGAVKRGDLDECKPDCSQDRIDGVRPFFVAGDVLAGFGLLALGAAVVTYFAVDTTPAKPARAPFPFSF